MTTPPDVPNREEQQNSLPASPPVTNLKPLRVRGSILGYAVVGALLGGSGLLLVTILPVSPWLFLLYPLLFALLLISFSAIVLHLLHRF